jgi:hypothetical protein
MLRTVEIPGDQITVKDGQIELHGANIGEGRIVGLKLFIEEPSAKAPDEGSPTLDPWERELEELLADMPRNPFPCDDSREAIYGPDPDEIDGE